MRRGGGDVDVGDLSIAWEAEKLGDSEGDFQERSGSDLRTICCSDQERRECENGDVEG
jgi:hypothetical protein